jgi:hypothetical protein
MDLREIDRLSECIVRAIQDHLANSNIEWSHIDHPILRVEAFLEDTNGNSSMPRSQRIASVRKSLDEVYDLIIGQPC